MSRHRSAMVVVSVGGRAAGGQDAYCPRGTGRSPTRAGRSGAGAGVGAASGAAGLGTAGLGVAGLGAAFFAVAFLAAFLADFFGPPPSTFWRISSQTSWRLLGLFRRLLADFFEDFCPISSSQS
jgi:hypothetical protein